MWPRAVRVIMPMIRPAVAPTASACTPAVHGARRSQPGAASGRFVDERGPDAPPGAIDYGAGATIGQTLSLG